MAERARREQHRRRLLPDVAVADDGVARLNAGLGEQVGQLVRRLEEKNIERHLREGDALRAGNVTRALIHSMRAAVPYAVIERRVASIDDGDTAFADVLPDVRGVDDNGPDAQWSKRAHTLRRRLVGDVMAVADPRGHPPVEEGCIGAKPRIIEREDNSRRR